MAKQGTSFLEKVRLVAMGAKSPVPKHKRKILSQAEKEILQLEGLKTERTRDIERRTGVPSDIEKKKKETARRARQSLLVGADKWIGF